MVTLPDGEKTFYYITKADAKKHAEKKSRAHSSGPWQTDFASMAEKTCMRKIFKWLPKSTDAAIAMNKDDGVVSITPEEAKSSEGVLEAQVSHVVDVDADIDEAPADAAPAEPEAADMAEQMPETGKKPSTKDDLATLEERMDEILGGAGLDLTAREREQFIAESLGVAELSAGWRTVTNVKRVIAAAEALLRAREEA